MMNWFNLKRNPLGQNGQTLEGKKISPQRCDGILSRLMLGPFLCCIMIHHKSTKEKVNVTEIDEDIWLLKCFLEGRLQVCVRTK